MSDPNIVAGYRRAISIAGIPVQFQRINGQAPYTASIFANVTAVVREYSPDGGEASRTGFGSSHVGAITQGDRMVIVLEDDLNAQRFPLPLKKSDKVIIVSTGQVLTITEVDAFKRAVAGAIELKASGVQ